MAQRGKGGLQIIKLFVILVIGIIVVEAVDRARFKTCNQSGFCERNRDYASQTEKETPYEALPNTVIKTPARYFVDIINKQNGAKFLLGLSLLENGIIRVKINEKAPLHQRYEVPDVLSPTIQRLKYEEESDLIFGQVKLQFSPLKLDFYSPEGELVLSANGRGLFNIEHLRENKENGDGEGVFEVVFDDKYKKMQAKNEWSESFGTHSDSKPKGPSSVSMDFSFIGSQAVYGIPEHASSFALKTTVGKTDPYRLYNLDVFEYVLDDPMALYGSIPFMMSQRQGKSTAVFWLNASETWVDIDNSPPNAKGNQVDTHWFSESGVVDFFVLFGPKPKDIFYQYKYLTGFAPIPPLFSISYHQCRWNYRDQDDVATVNEQYDVYNLPLDVIWLDIEHTDQKKYFTWDSTKFSEPKQMIDNLESKGRRMVTIVDPHIKKDDNYFIYSEGKERDFFVKKDDGKQTYEGWCWPGASMYLDFSNPSVRNWWSDQFSYEKYIGSTKSLFIWNDMNEPSVFNGPEVTMYKDLIHYNDVEHRDLHNMWGLWVHKATADGLVKRSNNQSRPFVLSRAFFAGSQKYGAIWTGDNKADWGHLEASVPMLLSINIAGISFSGADVGGFFGNPDTELLIRWYQAGAYQPFFRAHAHIDTKRREPYLYDDQTIDILRDAIRSRYSLLPYWYTQFYHDSITGVPVMRPLWVEFPEDQSLYSMEDQYLVGSDILVKPVVSASTKSVNVYFPGHSARWFDILDYTEYAGNSFASVNTPINKIPVFQRGGSIIPRKERARRSTSAMVNDPYTLIIALDSNQSASGDLYVDDYESLNYQNGIYLFKQFTFANSVLSSKNLHNQYPNNLSIERIVVVGSNKKFSKITFVENDNHASSMNVQFWSETSPSRTTITTLKKPANFAPLISNDNWKIIFE